MTHQAETKWTDTFLDALRQQGDPLADQCFEKLRNADTVEKTVEIFKAIQAHDTSFPDDTPEALRDFFNQTRQLPDHTDQDRIKNGEDIFLTHAFPSALVLLTKSLPSGYAAPNLSIVLHLSGNLETNPYKRTLGVLQMMVNISTCQGFCRGGEAVVTAQKLRLLHAGVRSIVRRRLPNYEPTYGVPVNHEDMLGTIMGFSYLIIEGFRTLDIGLTPEEEEDYFYLWSIYAQLMGIPLDAIPTSVADAADFYNAYACRHYVPATENPEGVKLALADLRMLQDMLPSTLRRFGLKIIPRVYMQELMGRDACQQVGIKPVRGHFLLKWLLLRLPGLWLKPWEYFDTRHSHVHEALSRMIFQGMINREYGGKVTFSVPGTLIDLRNMA